MFDKLKHTLLTSFSALSMNDITISAPVFQNCPTYTRKAHGVIGFIKSLHSKSQKDS